MLFFTLFSSIIFLLLNFLSFDNDDMKLSKRQFSLISLTFTIIITIIITFVIIITIQIIIIIIIIIIIVIVIA